ncbi:MAG: NfeD family protein, partial [Bacteroidota bacterium]|nr:NfeD family protein [Bacteroidota bacterium]
VISLASEVVLGMVSYVQRAVEEAEKAHAVILLHVNTFGGRLDAATKIRDLILNAKVPMTVAFVDKRAISAGALITLAAQKIVMSSGSTMGAATPIYETGEKASEKVNSYMRAEMRSTAERNHRDPRIAETMVDESIGLDSSYKISVPQGKLLTLTEEDAIKVGYADAKAETVPAALQAVGISATDIVNSEEGFGDKLIRFLTSGLVSSLLIMIGMAGVFYTIKTGHFGAITIAAIAAFVLFFGGQYITSVAPLIAIVLFLAGLTLLLIEISPVPTFGLAGVLGIAGVAFGLFLALAGDLRTLTPDRMTQTFVTLAIALTGVIVLGYVIIKYAPKSLWLRKFRNEATTADTGFYAAEEALIIGKSGIAQTMLRPAGIVLLGDRKIDAVTGGEFLPPGTAVTVMRMSGNRAVVQAATDAVTTRATSESHISEERERGDSFGGRIARTT